MRILATFAFAFAAAIALAVYLPVDGLLLPAGMLLALLALAAALMRKRGRAVRRAALILAGLAVGLLWTRLYSQIFFRPAQELDGQTLRLSAMVVDRPQEGRFGGCSVLVELRQAGMPRTRAILYTDAQGEGLRPGDEISTIAHMTLGDRTFSGQPITYYTAKGIFLRGEAYGQLEIRRPDHVPLSCWPSMFAIRLRDGIAQSFPPEQAGVVQALVTGNRDGLTDQFTTSLQRTGLSHTVAVSGMHLSFLAGLLTALLGRGKRSTAVLTVLWAVFFCGVAGNTPSVLRAAVMIILLQLAPLLGRERDGPTALAFALMVLLAADPFSAAHVGLQLSFCAVAGILSVSGHIQDWLVERLRLDRRPGGVLGRWLMAVVRFMVSTLAATLGASVFTIPLVALHFQTLSLIAPLSNLMTLWAVGLLFVGGLVTGVVGAFWPWLGRLLALPLTGLVDHLEWTVELLSRPALATLELSSFYYWAWIVFAYLLLILTVRRKGKKPVLLPVSLAAAGLVLVVGLELSETRMGEGAITVLDVGQGQSVLVRMGDALALIDCGGDSYEDPGDIAADQIQAMGRSRLDLLVLSHYHADHANGACQLMSRIGVDTILLPDVEEDDRLRAQILQTAQQQGTQVRFISREEQIGLSGGAMTVYPPMEGGQDTNELGLAVLVQDGSFSALITGDMSTQGEQQLLDRAELDRVELLVVGHHGAATSTGQALLDALEPKTAVISVGADNRYGHPDGQVLARLAQAGAVVYRTDCNGDVTTIYG